MFLNKDSLDEASFREYRRTLLGSTPKHIVIDDLFDSERLNAVLDILRQEERWQTQKHAYSALYVNDSQWQASDESERFVQRDVWQRRLPVNNQEHASNRLDATSLSDTCVAEQFLLFLRSGQFMSLLSRIFKVVITDINVANPSINTNYFRLAPADFVKQHADDSPSREVCMLLYLNRDWQDSSGGELVFQGLQKAGAHKGLADSVYCPVYITPKFNRCVLFDPASQGAEHWVNAIEAGSAIYRYNVTSWYWSE